LKHFDAGGLLLHVPLLNPQSTTLDHKTHTRNGANDGEISFRMQKRGLHRQWTVVEIRDDLYDNDRSKKQIGCYPFALAIDCLCDGARYVDCACEAEKRLLLRREFQKFLQKVDLRRRQREQVVRLVVLRWYRRKVPRHPCFLPRKRQRTVRKRVRRPLPRPSHIPIPFPRDFLTEIIHFPNVYIFYSPVYQSSIYCSVNHVVRI